jgi:hypothetical protein
MTNIPNLDPSTYLQHAAVIGERPSELGYNLQPRALFVPSFVKLFRHYRQFVP